MIQIHRKRLHTDDNSYAFLPSFCVFLLMKGHHSNCLRFIMLCSFMRRYLPSPVYTPFQQVIIRYIVALVFNENSFLYFLKIQNERFEFMGKIWFSIFLYLVPHTLQHASKLTTVVDRL